MPWPRPDGDLAGTTLRCPVADGERERGRWTVLVSGSPLGGEFVRWDGDDLNAGLSRVLAELQERVPGLLD